MLARRAMAGVTVVLAGAGIWPAHQVAAASPDATAQVWYQHVVSDLRPLQSSLLGALTGAAAWTSGSESAATARREFARELPSLERVHRELQHVPPLNDHVTARDDYASGIGLYAASLQVIEAATELPAGALRTQLQNSSQRIRELGDIVFDQGTAELAPLLGSDLAGPDVAASSHVPDWSDDGLAPAAPLVPSWGAGSTSSSGSQPKAAWVAEVAMDGAPTQSMVRAALVGDPRQSRLARMAVALGAAEAYVSSVPSPAGDQLGSNRLRLGLLVDAEAVFAAEAGHLSHGMAARALATTATSLEIIGGQVRAES